LNGANIVNVNELLRDMVVDDAENVVVPDVPDGIGATINLDDNDDESDIQAIHNHNDTNHD